MKKTLYSLTLSDDVVREVDKCAHRMGTNRSNLVNRILAEYVGLSTPEGQIAEVLSALNALIAPTGDLVPFFVPNAAALSMKSSLEYKYRPTVKYEVELSRERGDSLGTLGVIFRTQSARLTLAMSEFFSLIAEIENRYLSPRLNHPIRYAISEGRFVRTIALPQFECTSDELAQALSAYIRLFDLLLKGWLAGRLSALEVEGEYVNQLKHAALLV